MFIPPMLFMTLLLGKNISLEHRVQNEISPDGYKIAKVYLGSVGVVDADMICSVRVSQRWLPFIEKEIFMDTSGSANWCDRYEDSYVQWSDDGTVLILETGMEIKPAGVGFDTPLWLEEIGIIFILLFSFLSI